MNLLNIEGGKDVAISTTKSFKFTIGDQNVANVISKAVITFDPDKVVTAEVEIAIGEVYMGLDLQHVKVSALQIETLNERLAMFGYEIVRKADAQTVA